MRWTLAFSVLALLTGAAQAELRITADPGGELASYIQNWTAIRESGERVVVDGLCLSACTMLLGFIPSERLCITQRAVFGFHQPFYKRDDGGVTYSLKGAERLMSIYPPAIRLWILKKSGGRLPKQMQYLKGEELTAIYPPCQPDIDSPTVTAATQLPTPAQPSSAPPAELPISVT